MSTTTTKVRKARPTSVPIAAVLQDYELRHSGALDTSTSNANPRVSAPPKPLRAHAASSANPTSWDTNHRRVPPFRPINRHRDPAETSVYQNGVERVFITTMFAGLCVNATAAKVWRSSIERLGIHGLFRYAVGGEI